MVETKVRKHLVEILNSLGTIRQDGYIWLHEFKDKDNRIRIVGIVSFTNKGTSYGRIFVELNLPSVNAASSQFLLSRQTQDWTVVDISEAEQSDTSRYQRPGKWINYVTELAEHGRKKAEEVEQSNHQPVEDNGLFD